MEVVMQAIWGHVIVACVSFMFGILVTCMLLAAGRPVSQPTEEEC